MVIKLSESNGYGVSEMIYDILDGHYSSSSGDINEQYLQDDVYMWLKNEQRLAKEITNTRRKVTAIVWQAFINLINYYGNEEYGSGYGWKMDQKAVQRWFKKYGADYKEVLAPVVSEVEQLRNERLGKKESVRTRRRSMKESSEFNPQDYYDLLYDQRRPSSDMIQAYRDYLGPDLANSYEAERIGENKLGYCDCYCCKCGQYLERTNCPTGWYHYVAELGDDEGHAWRDFCDDCWEEVSDMSADEILDTFEPAPYGEDLGPNYKTESVKRTKKKFRK